MYSSFRDLNCIAEKVLQHESEVRNKELLDRMFVPNDMFKNTNSFMDFTISDTKGCENIRNPNTRFCDRKCRNEICTELIDNDRENNGNNQKLFLYSTKNKLKSPAICTHVFTDDASAYSTCGLP